MLILNISVEVLFANHCFTEIVILVRLLIERNGIIGLRLKKIEDNGLERLELQS